jgi:hypothetical protein
MKNTQKLAACGAIAFALGGCGASGGSPQTPAQANVSANVLQFAVGTANYAGTPALNVVTTYRQPTGGFKPGDSGTLLNSPTLTLPTALSGTPGSPAAYDGTSTIVTGPASSEIGTTSMTSTSQNPGSSNVTTFGQSGGVFGLGIEPFNATAAGDFTPPSVGTMGQPFQVAPYPVPVYDSSTGTDPNQFVAWGGPPAFVLSGSNGDSVVGSPIYPTGTAGISEGIDVFLGITPVPGGSYSLSVLVPANTGNVTQSKSFTLPASLTTLGTATAPTYVPDGSGGGTFAFTMPSGATEAYLEVIDFGPSPPTATTPLSSCNGASTSAPVYYTIETASSGTLTLPDTIGPGGAPSVCTAAQNTSANGGAAAPDDFVAIQVVGFDYPAYEMSYPKSLGNPSPAILGANGEDDITISAAICQQGAAACPPGTLPLLKHRSLHAPTLIRRR